MVIQIVFLKLFYLTLVCMIKDFGCVEENRNSQIKDNLFYYKRFLSISVVYEMKPKEMMSKKLIENLQISKKNIFIVSSSQKC